MANSSDKSRAVTLILGLTLGVFGAHRFYAGKIGTGLLMLVTVGGCGIWYLVDNIMIATGGFRDAEGKLISRWEPEGDGQGTGVPQELLDEIYALRTEVNELHERVEFNERLLAERTGARPDDR
ncbi:MAG: NINE protein [Gemmatimonadales bacterium]|nr:NINE protein [Gemmatimonadales bacterium]